MPEEDIYAVIAYIRTLKPIRSNIPPPQIDFPVNILIRTMPMRYRPGQPPADSDAVAYGKYASRCAPAKARVPKHLLHQHEKWYNRRGLVILQLAQGGPEAGLRPPVGDSTR